MLAGIQVVGINDFEEREQPVLSLVIDSADMDFESTGSSYQGNILAAFQVPPSTYAADGMNMTVPPGSRLYSPQLSVTAASRTQPHGSDHLLLLPLAHRLASSTRRSSTGSR